MSAVKSYNPATLEFLGETQGIVPEVLPDLILKSRAIQKRWVVTSIKSRLTLLKKLLYYVSDNIEDIAKVIHQETGKPKIEAINSDVIAGMGAIRFSIDVLKKVLKPKKIPFKGMKLPMRYMGRSSYIVPKPVGVVGIISPWNFPFGIPFSQIIMAIAVGNSVILKPSSSTVLTGLKIGEVFEKAGFPKDLVQVVPGDGNIIGNALAKSDVDRLIFTGSVVVGKEIMKNASQRLTPVALELGDKSPMVVFNDTDLERTVNGALWNSFVNSGQVCASIKRIYVQESVYDEFVIKLKDAVQKLRQGWNWDDPNIDIGPLINKSALEKIEKHIERAKEQGATIITGGKRNPDLKGYFFEPTIITNVKQSDDVVQEEIFGPIIAILKFSSEEEAIRLANDTKFGLFGSVWTIDLNKGKRVAEQLTMGTVAVNNHTYTYGLPQTPWGGNKNSGFGRTHGLLGFQELLEPHHVHVDKGKFRKDLWWFPYNKQKLNAQYDIMKVLFLKKYRKMLSLIKGFK